MLEDDEFRRLLDYMERPWAGYRKVRKGVKKRVRRHMQSLGCTDMDAYLGLILHDRRLRAACEQHLLVTISRFFRDRRLWGQLHACVLPDLMESHAQGLKAWSAGCANGEEPYSLAMLWEDLAANTTSFSTLNILATDADTGCIQRAEKGRYALSSLKELPQHYKDRYFKKVPGSRQWQINRNFQTPITWKVHQLLDSPPSGPFYMILLRNNLLTYYQGHQMAAALKRILATLAPGGVLILGTHELLPAIDFPLRRDAQCPWIYHAMS